LEVLGDTHCGSGQTRAALRAAGHLQTIKPIPLQSTVAGGFTVHDFQIDQQAGTAKCPAGYTAPITSSCRASFARHCQHCPLRGRCTTAKRDRTIQVHPNQDELRAGAARPPAASSKATGAGGRWWNARSPGWSPTAAGGCPTADRTQRPVVVGARRRCQPAPSAGAWPCPPRWRLGAGLRPLSPAPSLGRLGRPANRLHRQLPQ
jgi:hypothetical protein